MICGYIKMFRKALQMVLKNDLIHKITKMLKDHWQWE